jgi:hypothetical protein
MKMTIILRDGSHAEDPRLGRLVEFDERSRQYPIRSIIKKGEPRSYTWRCETWLDQGREGACVGFSWAHDVAARPTVVKVGADVARGIYRRAQQIDEWPGEEPTYEGTSVLAGAKATQERGYLNEYRWAFGIDDLIMAVGWKGPAILGINWYEGMFDTDAKGFITPRGRVMGGHAILAHSMNMKEERFILHNSWGRSWGVNGEAKISFASVDRLLREYGEACIPVKRVIPKPPKV